MEDDQGKLLHAGLTYRIRGVLIDVGNKLWPGLPEADVQRAVSLGLARRRIPHETEKEYHLHYHGIEVGRYYCDVVVDNKVILELKIAPQATNLHRAQILSYLRVTGADVGLLACFGGRKVDIIRYAAFYARRHADFAWVPMVPDDRDLVNPKLVGALYKCLHRVHYELGPGFLHHVYRRAAEVEMRDQNLAVCFMREIPVFYEGEFVSMRPCRLLIVEEEVIVAAFAVKDMHDGFDVGMRRYLEHLGMELGLLANFAGEKLDIRPVRVVSGPVPAPAAVPGPCATAIPPPATSTPGEV